MQSSALFVLLAAMIGLLCLHDVRADQASSLLKDAPLATFAAPGSPWKISGDASGGAAVNPISEHGGVQVKTTANAAAPLGVEQTLELPAGLYELTATAASPGGRLVLQVGQHERQQALTADPNVFGLLVDWPGGPARCVVAVIGSMSLQRVELLPATPQQRDRWTKQQQDWNTFGFKVTDAQRPTPGSGGSMQAQSIMSLQAMTDRAVFIDDRLDFAVQVPRAARLIDWLADHGFNRLDSDQLRDWMAAKVQSEAYGSVVVMAMGIAPDAIAKEVGRDAVWYRYLAAGGRIVWMGIPPFYAFQSADCQPMLREYGVLADLDLPFGWGSPYWGRHAPVHMTEQGKQWGLELMGQSYTGFPSDKVSVTLSGYELPDGQEGAAGFFLNINPGKPWSGLIWHLHNYDGNNDAVLRDAWRLAHYTGKTVADIPALPPQIEPPPPPAFEIDLKTGDLHQRSEFARGETVQVIVKPKAAGPFDTVDIKFARADKPEEVLAAYRVQGRSGAALSTEFDTAPYALGEYNLDIEVSQAGKPVARRQTPLNLRHVHNADFHWEVWFAPPQNRKRADIQMRDIVSRGFDIYNDAEPHQLEWALRMGRRSSYRLHADGLRSGESAESAPQKFIREPSGDFRRFGNRPRHGLSHPDSLEVGRQQMIDYMKRVVGHPSYSGYILTNDDFSSLHYGIDYSAHNTERFRRWTGQMPATQRPQREPGIVPDNDPWLMWCLFTVEQVTGGWNHMQKLAVTAVDPSTRIGPVPGGMMIPLINMFPAGQYPPLNFGDYGHNLIASYYYNSYWQPLTTNTCWMEAGRMRNRTLPQWITPELRQPLTTYTRNCLYSILAGGVRGISYFIHDHRTAEAWAEMLKQWPMIERVGPVQARMMPTGRRIALLHSVTTDMFREANWLLMPYAYANLIQAHYDVDIIAEEEVLDGVCKNYDAVLLYRAMNLRQSVHDALVKHAQSGGLVLLDRSMPYDIPGAKRLDVDWAMGADDRSRDIPPDGAHAATPGPYDYAKPNRIAAVAEALSQYVKPAFRSDAHTLVMHPFEFGGVKYLWFVNTLSTDEYAQCRKWRAEQRTPEALAAAQKWERDLLAAEPTFSADVQMENLGDAVLYDVRLGQQIPVQRDGSRASFNLSMDRLGGTMLAVLPEAVATIAVNGPRQVTRLARCDATIAVKGASGPLPGVVPVRLTLTDPSGAVSPLSAVVGAERGIVRFNWTPALNDLSGKWTLTATELLSNRSASRTWELAAP